MENGLVDIVLMTGMVMADSGFGISYTGPEDSPSRCPQRVLERRIKWTKGRTRKMLASLLGRE